LKGFAASSAADDLPLPAISPVVDATMGERCNYARPTGLIAPHQALSPTDTLEVF
jgi:hypothetical protein